MFEKASRLKVRFDFKGLCTVEDLWDLNVQQLDKIYQNLVKEYESQQGVSLLNNTSDSSRIQTPFNKKFSLKTNIIY